MIAGTVSFLVLAWLPLRSPVSFLILNGTARPFAEYIRTD